MATVNTSGNILDIRRRIIMNSPHTETVTSDIASFDTDMSAKLKSCKLKFLPIQNGSGDPSPTNKRRIVGLTSIKYRKTGRNLANVVSYSGVSQNMETASKTTNNYGTTLSTTEFTAPHGEVTITQANYSDNTQESYRNGYFTVQIYNLEYGKRYNVSFKISDITNNPLNVNSLYIYGPNGSGGAWGTMIGDRMVFKNVGFNQPSNGTFRKAFEIRPCGMSFTLSDFMVTTVDDEDPTWEPYVGIEDRIMIPPKGKNIANFLGYSASTENVYGANKVGSLRLSGNYGQTISTTEYDPDGSLTVTQTKYPQTSNLPHYQNGYFCPIPDNLEYGEKYIVSFDVNEITNNPLNATLEDIRICPAYGSQKGVTVNGNRLVSDVLSYDKNPNDPLFTKHSIEIRNCGMSMTISHIMVTADTETNQTYEPFEFGAYGGYIDLVSGEIVSEYGVIDLGDMNWSSSNSTYGSFVATDIRNLSNAFISRSEPGDMFCDKAKVVSTDTFNTVGNGEGECWIQINGNQTVYIMSTDFIGKNVNNVTNMVKGTQLVYRLAEPIHTLIDPESLKTLRGANVIWTDSNDETSVTYYTH